ncbi:hypothetical protein TWF225_008387 [Orbilia oligospora]|uniref:Uncharacterized protein n=1 Tax=Orbilia oligospora TaxID=2813651 RepID=A0A7C8KDJ3_ORBOL|nr:hypothetical protein TWF751_007451 [Orbilia oligospora]KAF3177399.1 hypothetical protein TWF225_008387 [Orbilia oligospora]KAF3264990.1 hypothetical protein TWF217_002644 [Orbilia oligospora]KAF3268224.1 hypothetical protein TWF128_008225 [Orbilia oligospora]KAF3295930.1 hypothetical protein TWF132_000475 [Orbilia oligospora]
MLFHSTIVALALATTFGVVNPSPVSSSLNHRPNLKVRDSYMSPRCKNLEELDYRQICFYQPADAPEGGVTAAELLKWLEAARSKNRNGYGWSYTVVTKPGESKCRQVSCISRNAALKICDLRSGPSERNHTWAASTIYSTASSLLWRFWPDLPTDDAEGQKVAAQTQSDTKTCCSSYYNPGRVPQTTDRMWGEQYQADETGLKITIEAVRQAVDYDIENRALCDPEQNLIPVYNAPEEGGEESELPVKEWKDSDPSWTTPPTD